MNYTNHVLERYCQRVMGMSEADSKTYVRQKRNEILPQVEEIFQQSECFWHGSYNGTFADADYYFHKNGYIFVKEKDSVVTFYLTDYGFDGEIDKKIAKDLFTKVNKLRQKNEKGLGLTQGKLSQREMEIQNINSQIELLQMQKNKLLSEKDILNKDIEIKQKELDDTALKLINSLQFRMELMAFKGKKAG